VSRVTRRDTAASYDRNAHALVGEGRLPTRACHSGRPVTDPDLILTPASGISRLRSGSSRDRRATYYCMWCRWPLADDGRTRLSDRHLFDSDECALLRTCDVCKDIAWVRAALKARYRP
jgi:hypothetical protein